MTTELEETQLEIAKLQLEQEQHKLNQMKKRRKVVDDLGSGAAVVGGAAVKGAGSIARYIGRWIFWAIAVEGVIALIVGFLAKPFASPNGFWYAIGEAMGQVHAPNIISVLLAATALAFFSTDELGKKKSQVSGTLLPGIPAAVFALWYFLR